MRGGSTAEARREVASLKRALDDESARAARLEDEADAAREQVAALRRRVAEYEREAAEGQVRTSTHK